MSSNVSFSRFFRLLERVHLFILRAEPRVRQDTVEDDLSVGVIVSDGRAGGAWEGFGHLGKNMVDWGVTTGYASWVDWIRHTV